MKRIFILPLLLLCVMMLSAHDLVVDGKYYNLLDDNTVELTYCGSSYDAVANEYYGSVVIPDVINTEFLHDCKVTRISQYAFAGCTEITSVTIGAWITKIGSGAFDGCTNLHSIYWNAPIYSEMLIDEKISPLNGLGEQLTNLVLGDYIQVVPKALFYRMDSLETLTVGPNVVKIEKDALWGLEKLTNVTWNAINYPDSATYNGYLLFPLPLTNITFGPQVQRIPANLCQNRPELKEVIIPENVVSIGDSAFVECEGLQSVKFYGKHPKIGKAAFARCTALKTFFLPELTDSIRAHTFENCTALEDLYIPASVRYIGDAAFKNCEKLPYIDISKNVEYVGNEAFSGCKEAQSIVVGENVSYMGRYAFDVCTSASSVQWNARDCNVAAPFRGMEMFVNDFVIGDQVTALPDSLCFYMRNLASVTIPESVTTIGKRAFCYCNRLKQIVVPNRVKRIDNEAFACCDSLHLIVLGKEIDSLGENLFQQCWGLHKIICYANSLPKVEENTFVEIKDSVDVYVPAENVERYKRDPVWGELRIRAMGASIVDNVNSQVEVVAGYDNARFTWPIYEEELYYILAIYRGEDLCYELYFNSSGEISNVVCAPSRHSEAQLAEAEQAERAFRFTVQGLSPNTGYRYELQSRNLQSEVVNSYTGFFVTTDVMAVPLLEDGADFVKFLRDGQVLIQRGDVVYDLRGQIVNE